MLRPEELVIDNFAGGGGASEGIEAAIGRPIDVALNHDEEACALYRINHPHTEVLCQSVFRADPLDVVAEASRRRGSRKPLPVGLAWFSPDCTDHSKAKGAAPIRNLASRDLAWVIIPWADRVGPRVIAMENVEEWLGWGPVRQRRWPEGTPLAGELMVDLHGSPVLERDPDREGETFRRWLREFRRAGYRVEWREERACHFGAPTIRKRLILIARRDGRPIVWPARTHGPGLLPFRTAAECIDWSIPCPSIFTRKRPLAEKTLARIARGIRRYVIDAASPFIVPVTHAGDHRIHALTEPLRTITTAPRGEHALITPHLMVNTTGHAGAAASEPLHTVTTGNHHALIAPHMIRTDMQSAAMRNGVTAATEPLRTVTTSGGHALVAPCLAAYYGTGEGGSHHRVAGLDDPLRTVTVENRHALVSAFLAQHYGGPQNDGYAGRDARDPLATITARGTQQGLVAAHLLNLKGTDRRDAAADAPAPTITGQGMHVAEVRAFLLKYYETAVGQRLDEPAHTTTTKARLGLVTVAGVDYQIVDIGMRMLAPAELYRAQGFRPDYVIGHGLFLYDGQLIERPLTKTAQIRMCGNSVSPPWAEAHVRAQFTDSQQDPAAEEVAA